MEERGSDMDRAQTSDPVSSEADSAVVKDTASRLVDLIEVNESTSDESDTAIVRDVVSHVVDSIEASCEDDSFIVRDVVSRLVDSIELSERTSMERERDARSVEPEIVVIFTADDDLEIIGETRRPVKGRGVQKWTGPGWGTGGWRSYEEGARRRSGSHDRREGGRSPSPHLFSGASQGQNNFFGPPRGGFSSSPRGRGIGRGRGGRDWDRAWSRGHSVPEDGEVEEGGDNDMQRSRSPLHGGQYNNQGGGYNARERSRSPHLGRSIQRGGGDNDRGRSRSPVRGMNNNQGGRCGERNRSRSPYRDRSIQRGGGNNDRGRSRSPVRGAMNNNNGGRYDERDRSHSPYNGRSIQRGGGDNNRGRSRSPYNDRLNNNENNGGRYDARDRSRSPYNGRPMQRGGGDNNRGRSRSPVRGGTNNNQGGKYDERNRSSSPYRGGLNNNQNNGGRCDERDRSRSPYNRSMQRGGGDNDRGRSRSPYRGGLNNNKGGRYDERDRSRSPFHGKSTQSGGEKSGFRDGSRSPFRPKHNPRDGGGKEVPAIFALPRNEGDRRTPTPIRDLASRGGNSPKRNSRRATPPEWNPPPLHRRGYSKDMRWTDKRSRSPSPDRQRDSRDRRSRSPSRSKDQSRGGRRSRSRSPSRLRDSRGDMRSLSPGRPRDSRGNRRSPSPAHSMDQSRGGRRSRSPQRRRDSRGDRRSSTPIEVIEPKRVYNQLDPPPSSKEKKHKRKKDKKDKKKEQEKGKYKSPEGPSYGWNKRRVASVDRDDSKDDSTSVPMEIEESTDVEMGRDERRREGEGKKSPIVVTLDDDDDEEVVKTPVATTTMKPLLNPRLLCFSLLYNTDYESIIDHFERLNAEVTVCRRPTYSRAGACVLTFMSELETEIMLSQNPFIFDDEEKPTKVTLKSPAMVAFTTDRDGVDVDKLGVEMEKAFGPVVELSFDGNQKRGRVCFIDEGTATRSLACKSQVVAIQFAEMNEKEGGGWGQLEEDKKWMDHRIRMQRARCATLSLKSIDRAKWHESEMKQIIEDQVSDKGKVTLLAAPIVGTLRLDDVRQHFKRYGADAFEYEPHRSPEEEPGSVEMTVNVKQNGVLNINRIVDILTADHVVKGYSLTVGLFSAIDVTTGVLSDAQQKMMVIEFQKKFGVVIEHGETTTSAIRRRGKYRITFMHMQQAMYAHDTLSALVGQPFVRGMQECTLHEVEHHATWASRADRD